MFERKITYIIPEGYREQIEREAPTIRYRDTAQLDPECYLSDTCWIVGDVRIGYHAVIMHGASLRGDCDYIEIGAETNVQENCILHESAGQPIIIGEHTTLGHGCVIHACEIGDNSPIGMNAVVLNGAKIGNNCIVGAGAVVPEGMVIPDWSMAVGIPAKIKRQIDQDDAVRIIESLAEGNLSEATRMYEEGLVFHPSEELLKKIGVSR